MNHYSDIREALTPVNANKKPAKPLESVGHQRSGPSASKSGLVLGEVAFSVACLPIPQPRQRHRVVLSGLKAYAQNYTPAKHPVNAFKQAVALAARQTWKGEPMTGPLEVYLCFRFSLPASVRATDKRRVKAGEHLAHSSKPDMDNVCKAIFDALTGIIWVDDRQIGRLTAEKVYAFLPGVDVWVGEWRL